MSKKNSDQIKLEIQELTRRIDEMNKSIEYLVQLQRSRETVKNFETDSDSESENSSNDMNYQYENGSDNDSDTTSDTSSSTDSADSDDSYQENFEENCDQEDDNIEYFRGDDDDDSYLTSDSE